MKAIKFWMLCIALSIATLAIAQTTTPEPKVHYDYPQVYTIVEQMPEYPGGPQAMLQFMKQNTHFPKNKLQDSTFAGCKTYIKMIIDSTGKVTQPAVIKGCYGCTECDVEAIRVVKQMPGWKPGRQGGKAVNVYYTFPFNFYTR